MKTIKILMAIAAVTCAGSFTSCSDNDDSGNGNKIYTEPRYMIVASSDEATYLVATDNLEDGSGTIEGIGKEVESATAWVFNRSKYAYRLVYNQGNPGVGSSYTINQEGKVAERSIGFTVTNRFTTYGNLDKYVIMAAAAATTEQDNAGNYKYGIVFTILDSDAQTKSEKVIVTENMTGNGEYYTVSGLVEIGGKIYSGLCPVGMSAYGVVNYADKILDPTLISTSGTISATQHPDEAYIAIFDGMDFDNPKILRDDRISYPTARRQSQYYNTLAAANDGYVYVFSASDAKTATNVSQQTQLNSGVIRINTATEEIDPEYHVDIETKAGGRRLVRAWHINGTKDYFLLRLYDSTTPVSFTNENARPNRLAIFKASDKSFTWVTGQPDINNIGSTSLFPYFEDGKAYMPIVTLDNQSPAIYVIDPVTATAKKGLTVTSASEITAVSKLEITQ